MPDRYAYARSRVADTLAVWKTGTVTLTRSTPGTPEAETPWIPGTPTTTVYTLDARVDGATADYIDGATVIATDLMVIASPKAADPDGAIVDIVPEMGDVLTIDGALKAIKKVDAVPAAGDAAMFHIFVAS